VVLLGLVGLLLIILGLLGWFLVSLLAAIAGALG
jgi:hypothetical protein